MRRTTWTRTPATTTMCKYPAKFLAFRIFSALNRFCLCYSTVRYEQSIPISIFLIYFTSFIGFSQFPLSFLHFLSSSPLSMLLFHFLNTGTVPVVLGREEFPLLLYSCRKISTRINNFTYICRLSSDCMRRVLFCSRPPTPDLLIIGLFFVKLDFFGWPVMVDLVSESFLPLRGLYFSSKSISPSPSENNNFFPSFDTWFLPPIMLFLPYFLPTLHLFYPFTFHFLLSFPFFLFLTFSIFFSSPFDLFSPNDIG
jgi:hypothetical protein